MPQTPLEIIVTDGNTQVNRVREIIFPSGSVSNTGNRTATIDFGAPVSPGPLHVNVAISQAEFGALHSAPVEIIPPPDAGFVAVVLSACLQVSAGDAFAEGSNVSLGYNDTMLSGAIVTFPYVSTTPGPAIASFPGLGPALSGYSEERQGIYLVTAADNVATATTPHASVDVWYYVVPVLA